jgi:2-isopropylmalate synthase
MCENMKYRENVIVSLHPHNDRGCAVADSELGLLAGADRIEGTCFGNGERTGNVDIVTLALNMFTHGVDPQLDFSDMPALVEIYERVTRMKVYDRTPYAGALVFAAFSGSHQDAIAKGMRWRDEKDPEHWTVPYLPLDPKDVGRQYDGDVIRINSQSGKGGIGYLLQKQYGYTLPKKMAEDFGYAVKSVSDHKHAELQPAEIYDIFKARYLNKKEPYDISEVHYVQNADETITAKITAEVKATGEHKIYEADGNGRLDAVANAIKDALNMDFVLETYEEHALERHSNSEAVSYISIVHNGKTYWGAGRHSDIIVSGVRALVSAINNIDK